MTLADREKEDNHHIVRQKIARKRQIIAIRWIDYSDEMDGLQL